ncbi:MAG: hypothetical protein VW405_00240 [Rhodospirillaceae bacterium]
MTRAPKDPADLMAWAREEALLAAPEMSEAETRKLLVRKAKEVAERERLRQLKSNDQPSVEDILADMIRVAEDPDVNPYHAFRTLSRRRYELFGHYPIEFLDEQFGQFNHAKEVAGLLAQPGTRAKRAARAAASRREHASRYIERRILPYCRSGERLTRELTDIELVLSISDTHATFLDPFTWQVFLCACRDLQPGVVVLNGDILEGGEISRHPKIPGWSVSLQTEFDFAREMFRQVREVVSSDCDVVWTAGNHGLDRLAMYLTQVAPELAGLRSLKFDRLAGIDDLDVTLAQGGTIASPDGQEQDAPGILLHGFYRIHHGTRLGVSPAAAELKQAGRSGQSGHVHRAQLVHGTSEADRTLSWMCTPMGCTERAGRAYMKGICTGWQKGFGVAFLYPGGRVRQYPVVTDDDVAIVEGYVYERPKDMPEFDVSTNWLAQLEVPVRGAA